MHFAICVAEICTLLYVWRKHALCYMCGGNMHFVICVVETKSTSG